MHRRIAAKTPYAVADLYQFSRQQTDGERLFVEPINNHLALLRRAGIVQEPNTNRRLRYARGHSRHLGWQLSGKHPFQGLEPTDYQKEKQQQKDNVDHRR